MESDGYTFTKQFYNSINWSHLNPFEFFSKKKQTEKFRDDNKRNFPLSIFSVSHNRLEEEK